MPCRLCKLSLAISLNFLFIGKFYTTQLLTLNKEKGWNIPQTITQKQCNDKHLPQIAIYIHSKDWKMLAALLGLSENDIDDIDIDQQFVQDKKMAMLRRWKEVYGHKATYNELLQALSKMQCWKTIKEISNTISSGNDNQDHLLIQSYSCHLKKVYERYIPSALLKWPPLPTYTYVALAMILEEKIRYGKVDDNFVKFTLHGQIDDILFKKKQIKLEEIFVKDTAKRKVILIEGAPGAGKSTLAWHICKEWQHGKLFQEFDLIVFIQFRDPIVQSAQKLSDMLLPYKEVDTQLLLERIEREEGRGILFLLDGWDELPLSLQQESIFLTMIKSPDKLFLGESAVIVTSRPISSADLQPLASSRIEIVGFTPPVIHQYFMECLERNESRFNKLITAVRINPMIESVCYLPLNAAIVVFLFRATDSLPSTLHDLFTSLIFQCIVRYVKHETKMFTGSISSLSDLPSQIQKAFDDLCCLAYYGVIHDLYVFPSTTLKELSFPLPLTHLGLMQAIPSFLQPGHHTYNFLHLSVQELLAAIHISKTSEKEQLQIFRDLLGHPRFISVFQFYAGITKLKTDGIHKILMQSILVGKAKGVHKRISVLRCLYEAQDPKMCQYILPLFKRKSIHTINYCH